jgi:hypothetical protein
MDNCSCCINSESCSGGGEFCFDPVTGDSGYFCGKIYNDPQCQPVPNPICKDYLPPSNGATSKGLYALSALALIPLMIVLVLVVQQFRKKVRPSAFPEPGKNPSTDLPPTHSSEDPTEFP